MEGLHVTKVQGMRKEVSAWLDCGGRLGESRFALLNPGCGRILGPVEKTAADVSRSTAASQDPRDGK